MRSKFLLSVLVMIVVSGQNLLAGTIGTISFQNHINHNMVVQRGKDIVIGGKKNNGEVLKLVWRGKEYPVNDLRNFYEVRIPAGEAGGPFELQFKGDEPFTLNNILVGDVYLASGQSNMEWSIGACSPLYDDDKAPVNSNVRVLNIEKTLSGQPMSSVNAGPWRIASDAEVGQLSAVATWFAHTLQKETKVPIGIVLAAYGGSTTESWVPKEALTTVGNYLADIRAIDIRPSGAPDFAINLQSELNARFVAWCNMLAAKDTSRVYSSQFFNWKKKNEGQLKFKYLNAQNNNLQNEQGIFYLHKRVNMLSQLPATDSVIIEYWGQLHQDSIFLNGVAAGGAKPSNGLRRFVIKDKDIPFNGSLNITLRMEKSSTWKPFEIPKITVSIGASKIVFENEYELYKVIDFVKDNAPDRNIQPRYATTLYNGMIHPLVKLPIKGVIWYQGESNVGKAIAQSSLFPALIEAWRGAFKNSALPFLFVQLPGQYTPKTEYEISYLAGFRNAQSAALLLPFTAMAVTTDLGDALDPHPKRKKEVGERLAFGALHRIYGLKGKNFLGPSISEVKLAGKKASARVVNASSLKTTNNSKQAVGFLMQDEGNVWHSVVGSIKGNVIEMQLPAEAKGSALAVRYAWFNNPSLCNVQNELGLPLAPYRSDNYNLADEGIK